MTPFPYAAIGIAAYTQKVEVNYDETATGILLVLGDIQCTSEEEVVAVLAKHGGLDGDRLKVRR